ncbi:hypothetical protein ACJIZ3_022900 [Penstemon smallii]|uniref:Uncharacterized protein n=1 Tax=Penstemon smallii TaxID=265156 RepID=A0ABD3TMN0_9LAMI
MQVISLLLLLCPLVQLVQCQGDFQNGINSSQLDNPTVLNQFTELVNQRLSSATSDLIHSEIAQRATFCVTDPEDDWNRSFNYSDNLAFLSRCIMTTGGMTLTFWHLIFQLCVFSFCLSRRQTNDFNVDFF